MHRQFTINGYTYLLELALKNGYSFIDFDKETISTTETLCLLRHDIDVDLKAAADMSALEARLGIKATYFLMIRSPVYNLFSRQNHKYTEDIVRNGAAIALHYDEGFYPANARTLQEHIETEAEVLEHMFGPKVRAVSFHQPSSRILSNDIRIKSFINTYDKEDLKGVTYFSDSNKIWKNESAWEMFETHKYKKVQLLVHPIWWMTNEERETEALWDKALTDNISRSLEQIIETEAGFGEKRSVKIIK